MMTTAATTAPKSTKPVKSKKPTKTTAKAKTAKPLASKRGPGRPRKTVKPVPAMKISNGAISAAVTTLVNAGWTVTFSKTN